MADVSVEFGATDVGLEKALQQIQTEMGNLQGKVKSGELSMEELEATMKRIGQVENMEKRLKAMGDASAESSPKIKKLGNDIDTAGSSAQSVGGIFDAEFKKIAGAFTVGNLAAKGFQKLVELAFSAAQAVVQGFSDALDLGGRLNELSQRTGETAGKLLVLETAFKNSGLEASTVGTAINKLQNFMQDAAKGGEKQRAAMQSLGVSMSELAGKTPTEQMKIFADRIAGIEDPTARAAAASEVFGDKLGGKLLPLFSDFSANLEDARAKVGSLEQVMDENAATFDAAAETIEAVKGKMAAFAAGVLGETIPAVRELGSKMEEVDAAGLGETVGKILSPALRDFTRDIQILLTIFDKLKQGFGDLGSALVGGAENFKKITQEANKYLQVLAALLPGGLNPATLAIKGLAATTKDLSTETDTASGKVDKLGTSAQATGQNIAGAFSLTSDFVPELDKVSASWGGVNDQILGGKNLLSESYNLADSMIGKIDEQTAGFGGVNEQLTTSKDLASLIDTTYGKHAEKLEKIQEKQAKNVEGQRELVELETQINEAKAAGNTELVTSLEKRLEDKKALEEIKKLTEEYQKTLGVNANEAARLANNFVNARNAANDIANRNVIVTVTTKVDDTRWKDLLAEIAANSDPKSVKIAMEVTGQDNLKDAYATLQNMETVNKNFQAAFTVIGAKSLEEVKANLEGIPTEAQRQLALQITGEEDFDRALEKLDRFGGTKEAKLLLQSQGFEKMDDFQNQLDGIVGEKRTKLLLEALNLKTVEEASLAIERILANDGKKATVSVGADTSEAEQKIQSVKQSTELPLQFQTTADITSAISEIDKVKQTALQPLTLNLQGDASDVAAKVAAFDGNPIQFALNGNSAPIINTIDALSSAPLSLSLHGDTTAVQSQIQEITGSPKKLDLNADQSIQQIQSDLKKEVDVSLQSSEGTKILSELKNITSDIKSVVEKLSNKLPVPALA